VAIKSWHCHVICNKKNAGVDPRSRKGRRTRLNFNAVTLFKAVRSLSFFNPAPSSTPHCNPRLHPSLLLRADLKISKVRKFTLKGYSKFTSVVDNFTVLMLTSSNNFLLLL